MQPPKGLLHGSLRRNSSTSFFGMRKISRILRCLQSAQRPQNWIPKSWSKLAIAEKMQCQGTLRNHPREQRAEATNLHKGRIQQQQQQQQYSRVDGWQGKRHWETRDGYWDIECSEFVGLPLPHPHPAFAVCLRLPALHHAAAACATIVARLLQVDLCCCGKD